MPNRILKDSVCTSDNIDALSVEAEVFFYRLMVQCDDYGRMDARPAVLRARCYPLRLDKVTEKHIGRYVKELVDAGLIAVYTVDGHPYLHLVKWDKHQQIRAQRSKYPDPAGADTIESQTQSSDINGNQPISDAPVIQSNTESESEGESKSSEGAGANAPPPPPDPKQTLLIDRTPQGTVLQRELETYYGSKGRNVPRHYQSVQQRDAYELVFSELGTELQPLASKGLARERSSLPNLLSWLQTCAKNNRTRSGPAASGSPEPKGMAGVRSYMEKRGLNGN